MSNTTVLSRDSDIELDSLDSDAEFAEWHVLNKHNTITKTTINTEFATSTSTKSTIHAKVAFADDDDDLEQEQRLHGGRSLSGDNLSVGSVSSAADDDEPPDAKALAHRKRHKIIKIIKIVTLFIVWVAFTCMLLVEAVHKSAKPNYICIPNNTEKIYDIPEDSTAARFYIVVSGPFVMYSKEEIRQLGDSKLTLSIKLKQSTVKDTRDMHDVSKVWILYIKNSTDMDSVEVVERKKRILLRDIEASGSKKLHISFSTNLEKPLPLEFYYEPTPVDLDIGIIVALCLVIGFYILLMLDVVHRALAIIVFCTLAIGMLAILNMRPSLRTIIDWINFEVLLLVFGFTLIIAILAETGIVDYLTMRAYEISNGHIWPILNVLCLFTFLGAAFYDNILLILLTTPITMRLCEVMELNPVPLLTCLIISANIGGVLTPNGVTPYDFIINHEILGRERIDWVVFIEHILPGTLIAAASAYIYMRILYHDSNSMRFKDGAEVERLRRVIKVWSRTAKSISPYSRDEQAMRDTVMSKVRRLRKRLKRVGKMPTPASDFKETLRLLRTQYQITNYALLLKCYFVLLFIFILTTLHLFPNIHYLSTAWTALLACIILLILADYEDFDGILGRIEWSSMLFLACVIVFSEATTQLGLFDAIGTVTHTLINNTTSSARLCVAILIVLWMSAFCASFLTDSSVSTMMLRAVIAAVEDIEEDIEEEHLPLQPLVWAVVLGTGLGGIGTIIGTFGNVICAGLAEKHGYNFPFLYYCKVGFPIMLVCVLSSTAYLLICHVLCHWH